jgi:hypothetical protein
LGLTVDLEVDDIPFFSAAGRIIQNDFFQFASCLGASRYTCTTTNASISSGRAGDVLRAKAAADTIAVPNCHLTLLDQCHISLTPWA